MRTVLTWIGVFALLVSTATGEEVFSGPQVGEKVTGFRSLGVVNDDAGKEFDFIEMADGKPVFLIFVHKVTRPSLGLARALMDYAGSLEGLTSGIVILTDDVTESENWMRRASNALPKKVPVTVSPDGGEGPGAYGLNRNVTLTVLIANEGKVTANFALIQPSVQADALPIAKQVAKVTGSKEPKRDDFITAREMMRGPDARLQTLLRAVIQKTASEEEVKKAAERVEAYVKEKKKQREQIGIIANRIVRSGKLSNYGTPTAQGYLKQWAEQYGPAEKETRDR